MDVGSDGLKFMTMPSIPDSTTCMAGTPPSPLVTGALSRTAWRSVIPHRSNRYKAPG